MVLKMELGLVHELEVVGSKLHQYLQLDLDPPPPPEVMGWAVDQVEVKVDVHIPFVRTTCFQIVTCIPP